MAKVVIRTLVARRAVADLLRASDGKVDSDQGSNSGTPSATVLHLDEYRLRKLRGKDNAPTDTPAF